MISSKQKTYLWLILILLIGLSASAQKEILFVYRSGTIIYEKSVSEIDSVIFCKSNPTGLNNFVEQDTMFIYRSGEVVFEKATIKIDSMNFRKITPSNLLVITGRLTDLTIEGCSVAEVPVAVNTVDALEMMPGSIIIKDACSAKEFLAVSSTDIVSGSCPTTVTRTYSIKDVCNNSVSIVHKITIQDTSPPVVTGTLSGTTVQGCPNTSAPVAVTTIAGLEQMAGLVTINDACTAKDFLTVSSKDIVSGNCPRTVTRTYTVKDGCNNSVSIDHIITIQEDNSPTYVGRVNIPAGTFNMGSPMDEVDRNPDETQHTVSLSAFRMSQYEITNSQYAEFLNVKRIGGDGRYAAGSYPTQILIKSSLGGNDWGLHYSDGKWVPAAGYENYPVIDVTWYGASEFAAYEGGRLPTEAEWEYACRAGTVTPFNTGICLSSTQANYDWRYPYLNCINNSNFTGWTTRRVDSNPPNAWGLYNMHGNVWEWCSDWGGPYSGTDLTNPSGPLTGTNRLIRGGGNSNIAAYCRSGFRNYTWAPEYSSFTIGIRLVFQSP